MAVQGTPLVLLYEHPATPPEFVTPIPIGDLNEPYVQTDPPYIIIGPHITNRFPVPPAAGGFLIDTNYGWYGEEEGVIAIPIVGLSAPYFINGAVYPESDFLEPTRGQIWPRIG